MYTLAKKFDSFINKTLFQSTNDFKIISIFIILYFPSIFFCEIFYKYLREKESLLFIIKYYFESFEYFELYIMIVINYYIK